jgi:hypothetical protein
MFKRRRVVMLSLATAGLAVTAACSRFSGSRRSGPVPPATGNAFSAQSTALGMILVDGRGRTAAGSVRVGGMWRRWAARHNRAGSPSGSAAASSASRRWSGDNRVSRRRKLSSIRSERSFAPRNPKPPARST